MGNPDPKRVASRHLTAGSKGVVSDLTTIERAYKAIFIDGLNSNSRIPNEAYIDEIQSRLDSIMDHCSEITHQSFRLEKAGKKFADNFDTTLSQDDLKIMRDAVNAITRVVNG